MKPTLDQLDHTISELIAMETQLESNIRSLQDRIQGLNIDLQSTVVAKHMIQTRRQELASQRVELVFTMEDVTQELTTYATTADNTKVIVNDQLIIDESPAITSNS